MPVLGRHVLLERGRPAPPAASHVHGDAHALVVDLDGALVEAQLDALAGQVVGHRVVVPLELDVVVDVDARELARAVGVRLRRQGPQQRRLTLSEDARP